MTATQLPEYTRIADSGLAYALRRRQAGQTFPAILAELGTAGFDLTGYDAGLLNHHVRAYCRQTGQTIPSSSRRPGLRRRGNRPPAARRFGVEIEVERLSQAQAAVALRNAGLQAEVESYNHQTRTHWKVTTDVTVRGCEVVSPPMSSWADVATAMTALREAGGHVNSRTGFHVHHEVADLDGASLARLVRMYADHADELDGLVAPSRRQGAATRAGRYDYCARPNVHEVRRLTAVLEGCTADTAEVRRRQAAGVRDVNRYLTLNTHSYVSYGTVEFRQHQGTLSGAKGEAWLLLGQAMIRAAVEARTFPTGGLVAGLRTAGCLADEPAEFLRRRAATLATA